MKVSSLLLVPLASAAVLVLAACGQDVTTPAPEASDVVPAPTEPVAAPVGSMPEMSIEQSCQRAVEILYGQTGDAVMFDASDFSVSWRAPVDGGRLNFACGVVGARVTLSSAGETQTVDLSSPAGTPIQQGAE